MDKKEYYALIDQAYADPSSTEAKIFEVIRLSKENEGEKSAIYASMLGELGGYYRVFQRYEESEKYFQMSLDVLGEINGEENADYATTLNNLAGCHRLMGKLDIAEEEFKKTLDIYEKTLGDEHVLYASALNNLSLIALDKGDVASATVLLVMSADVLSVNPSAVSEYATTLANLGTLYIYMEKFEDAEEALSKAASIYEEKVGTDSNHYYMILNSLGVIRLKYRDFKGAKEFFVKAADVAKSVFGEDHPEYKKLLNHIEIAQEGIDKA